MRSRPLFAAVLIAALAGCHPGGGLTSGPLVPPSPPGGPEIDPAVVAYLAHGDWIESEDGKFAEKCKAKDIDLRFTRQGKTVKIDRPTLGEGFVVIMTLGLSLIGDHTETLTAAKSDGERLTIDSRKDGRRRLTIIEPLSPDTLDIVAYNPGFEPRASPEEGMRRKRVPMARCG